MKRSVLLLMTSMIATAAMAQRPAADKLQTSKGSLIIQPVFHAAIVFTWNKTTVYVDPYGGAKAYAGLAAPDLIIITDIHPDHLNTETLNAIKTSKATFIVPKAVADQLPADMKSKCVIIGNGEKISQKEIGIAAIPMYNLPEAPDAMHTKGRGNGYILTFGGKTVYISGDTEDIPEMRNLKDIDVAFVCMNLPYTMDINQASSAVLDFKPKIVYPYHYRGKDGLSDIDAFGKAVTAGNKDIEVRIRNWYTEYK